MSIRLKAVRTRPDAGFALVEVLVALSMALLFMVVLARGFQMAWSRARLPAEATWALALARQLAAEVRNGEELEAGAVGNFRFETDMKPATIETLDSTLPPAPASTSQNSDISRKSVQPGNLEAITITITGPSGRTYEYESIKLDLSQD